MENRFSFGTHSYDFKGISERFLGNLLILENKAAVLIKNYEFKEKLSIICMEDTYLTLENVGNVKVEMYDNSRIDIKGQNNELDIELHSKSILDIQQSKRCRVKAYERSCIYSTYPIDRKEIEIELYDYAIHQENI